MFRFDNEERTGEFQPEGRKMSKLGIVSAAAPRCGGAYGAYACAGSPPRLASFDTRSICFIFAWNKPFEGAFEKDTRLWPQTDRRHAMRAATS